MPQIDANFRQSMRCDQIPRIAPFHRISEGEKGNLMQRGSCVGIGRFGTRGGSVFARRLI